MRIMINNTWYRIQPEDEGLSLLTFLREKLRLVATKNGCGEGHCGACTVIIDGKAELSCIKKMEELDGAKVYTLESLSSPSTIHAIQKAFIEEGAIQCGFCTPGMIMATKALLDKNLNPDDRAIKRALSRNICRCTGYVKIVNAVKRAAKYLREKREEFPRESIFPPVGRGVIGKSVPRVDALAKATGELKFTDDLRFENMLYTRVLRSDYPHARVVSLDVSEAEAVDGVVCILTHKDIPGKNRFGLIKDDQPVFVEDRVRFLGDAIAAVYAESEEAAELGVNKIRVRYEVLPVVGSIDEALMNEAPVLHGGESNIFSTMESGRGDTDLGFKEAEIVVESDYYTQFIEHAYLEPESGIAVPGSDGKISIYVGSQGPFDDIRQIAQVLDMPEEKIHIAHMPLGGGFGGKEDITVQIIVALGALKTGRPVKYTFSRRESIRSSTKRHAMHLHYKTGATRDGKIVSLKADIYADGGAYASASEAVILRAVSFAGGPYTMENASAKAWAVYTNNNPTGAMRGFGNPPVTFASEIQLNKIADRLGMDPFEIRLRNALDEGIPTITGDRIKYSVGIRECLLAVRDEFRKVELPEPTPGWKIGVGVAASYKNVGLGIGIDDSAGAYGEITEEGNLLVRVGSVDMGQGSDTVAAQIACERIGWPYSRIIVHSADSEEDPKGGMTTASRQTFVTGNAVYRMAEILASKIFGVVCDYVKRDSSGTLMTPQDVVLKEEWFCSKKTGAKILSLEDFLNILRENKLKISAIYHYSAPKTYFNLREPIDGYRGNEGRLHAAYCFGAQVVVIEVNPKTGQIRVLKVIAAHDAGRIINRQGVEGQIEGGIMMGLGYALSEEFLISDGRIITDTYAKLGVPKITRTPEIKSIIIENPHAEGPFGAKGMGELPISMGPPAIVSALHNALGIWINRIPLKPGLVLEALGG